MTSKYSLSPFFPKRVDDGERARRMKAFGKEIFSFWVNAAIRVLKPLDVGFSFDERVALHACDLAVFNSGIQVDRGGGNERDNSERKASVLEKAARAERMAGAGMPYGDPARD